MAKIKDGGPAFPHLGLYRGADGNLHPEPTQYCGVSMRDYFAVHALTGLMADTGYVAEWTTSAEDAYKLADAMLAAREAKP